MTACLAALLLGSAALVRPPYATPRHAAWRTTPAARHSSPVFLEDGPGASASGAADLPPVEPASVVTQPAAGAEWSGVDVASGAALFALLHSITQTGASALGSSSYAAV
eukprot:4013890-Prymnesium_polylepis.1